MDEQEKARMMYAVVSVAVAELTDLELAALNNAAQLDMDPHGRIFDYERVKGLFTQDGGTRMHEDTKTALARVVNQRLAPAAP